MIETSRFTLGGFGDSENFITPLNEFQTEESSKNRDN
jgi:hypothetical protein